MISMKSPREIDIIRRGGKITSGVLVMLAKAARPGMKVSELDRMAKEAILGAGAIPTFLGYRGYPSHLCASVNEEVVHGIPGERVLKDGDILSLDLATTFEGYVSDTALTIGIGDVSPEAERLMRVCQESLMLGIAAMQPGNRLGDIGHAVQAHAEKHGFGVVRDLVGHGIGKQMHEDPQVPNYGTRGAGMVMRSGLVLAVEPMINEGTEEVVMLDDGWTIITADGKLSAHFEHTIAITPEGPKILTLRENDMFEHPDVEKYRPKEEKAA
jgi:methionyl aminopeptidase